MTLSKFPVLISTHWLKQQTLAAVRSGSKPTTSLRILDTSWLPDPDVDGYRQFYLHAHIPTAVYFDLKKVSPPQKGSTVKFVIPDTNFFQDYVESLGISNNTHVVAYDRLESRPSFRTWFLFRLFGHDRVSVLNGGLRQWVADLYQVTAHESEVERGEFKVNLRPHLLRDFKDMSKNVDTQHEQVMDARGSSSFYVMDEDQPGGHIPGSKNIAFASIFNEDGTVKSEKDLKQLFVNAGINLSKPLVSSCQTGMTACALIAAAHMLGKEDVPLYNGSFHEWGALADSSKIARIKNSKS